MIYKLFLLMSFLAFTTEATIFNGWAHLELGAGNYGQDGHTKASQAKTILLKIKDVSDKKSYIDGLEEVGRGDYKPEEQYRVLFWTLDELVKRYGEVGVFHVNDLYEEYASFATQKLREYANAKGYTSIIVEAVPGDYQLIHPEQTLCRYGKNKYSSAHLKNPEVSLYHNRMDGDDLYATDESRQEARQMLEQLASLSESGLYLFILDHKDFIPEEEKKEFIQKNIFYQGTDEWPPVPYIFPEGNRFIEATEKVFKIVPK
jgi:hypothetical protein